MTSDAGSTDVLLDRMKEKPMTQLGIGAVCCGDPTDCTIECGQKDLLMEPIDVPTFVEVEPVFDEEEDDE